MEVNVCLKAVRKIDETRKRATDIVMQRRRNLEN